MFGGSGNSSPAKEGPSQQLNPAEQAKEARASAAEQRERLAEEKRAVAQAAAEAKKAAVAEAAMVKRKAAEEKRAAVAAAAQAKKENAAARVAVATKAKQAEDMVKKAKPGATISLFGLFGNQADIDEPSLTPPQKAASAKAKQAQDTVKRAKPGATISLFGFGTQKVAESPAQKAVKPSAQSRKVSAAPRGMPVISKWRQNKDGSVSGIISGSPSFEDGQPITTSPIKSDALGGAIAQTGSGSR